MGAMTTLKDELKQIKAVREYAKSAGWTTWVNHEGRRLSVDFLLDQWKKQAKKIFAEVEKEI